MTSSTVTFTITSHCNTVTSPSDSSGLYTSTVLPGPSFANAALPPHSHFQTSYFLLPILSLLPLLPHHRLLLLAVLLRLLLPLLPLTLSGFFNGMPAVSEPGSLNCYIFFHPILLTLSISRNLISTHFPLSGSLNSLLCDLIAFIPGLAFSVIMPRTLAAASSFSSGRDYPSLNFLDSLSLSLLDLHSDHVGVNISLKNSSSLSFFIVYAPPIRSSLSDGRTDSFSPSILPSSRNLFILGDFNCHHPLWDSKGTSDPCWEEVFDWVISSDLLPLNNLDILTLFHRSYGSRSSPDISFAPSSLALSCSYKVLQDLDFDYLPILLSVPLSPVFRPNVRPPSLNF